MMLYELDDIEKAALLNTELPKPRPGEKIQKFWCEGRKDWHEGSVLGGPIGDPHVERTNG